MPSRKYNIREDELDHEDPLVDLQKKTESSRWNKPHHARWEDKIIEIIL